MGELPADLVGAFVGRFVLSWFFEVPYLTEGSSRHHNFDNVSHKEAEMLFLKAFTMGHFIPSRGTEWFINSVQHPTLLACCDSS